MATPSETEDYPETEECDGCEHGSCSCEGLNGWKVGGIPTSRVCVVCRKPKGCGSFGEDDLWVCEECGGDEDDEEETEEEKAVSEMVADLVKGGMTEKEAGKLVGAMIASSYLLIAKAKGVATALREGRVTPDEGMMLMKALSEDVRTAVKAGRMTAEDGMRMYEKLSAMVMVEVTNAIVRG